MEKAIETERIIRSLKALIANSIINEYAVERVAFGFEKPGDKAPIDLYLQDSHLSINDFPSRQDIPGVYIDGQECISAEQDYAEYVRDLFVMKAERIFSDAPKDVCLERDGEEIPMLPRFRKYLFGLLPLFTEVLNVEVKCDAFDLIVTEKESDAEYPLWQKFGNIARADKIGQSNQPIRKKHFKRAELYRQAHRKERRKLLSQARGYIRLRICFCPVFSYTIRKRRKR